MFHNMILGFRMLDSFSFEYDPTNFSNSQLLSVNLPEFVSVVSLDDLSMVPDTVLMV